jgi:glucose dehydrogenase
MSSNNEKQSEIDFAQRVRINQCWRKASCPGSITVMLSVRPRPTGEVRWKYQSDAPMLANITATGADLVFAGSLKGDFIALDAKSGKVFYRHAMGATVAGGILTYRAGGKQFVAVETGGVSVFFGGNAPAVFTLLALP